MSDPYLTVCGGCWDYSRDARVRPAHHARLEPGHLDCFIGFRTFRSAAVTVHVTKLCTLHVVRGGCRNTVDSDGVRAKIFSSYLDSVGDQDTGFRCFLAGRRCLSRT